MKAAMSVQAALDFIEYMRERTHAHAIDVNVDDLVQVVQLGAQVGHEFTVDDLRAAFRHDWQKRWLEFGKTPQV
jgi:hypothetical protein